MTINKISKETISVNFKDLCDPQNFTCTWLLIYWFLKALHNKQQKMCKFFLHCDYSLLTGHLSLKSLSL